MPLHGFRRRQIFVFTGKSVNVQATNSSNVYVPIISNSQISSLNTYANFGLQKSPDEKTLSNGMYHSIFILMSINVLH